MVRLTWYPLSEVRQIQISPPSDGHVMLGNLYKIESIPTSQRDGADNYSIDELLSQVRSIYPRRLMPDTDARGKHQRCERHEIC
jgi:hypothetical protein